MTEITDDRKEIETTKTLTLRVPITWGGQTIETLDLREPTSGEMDKAISVNGTIIAQNNELISILSKTPRAAVATMCARDYRDAMKFLSVFMSDAPETSTS